MKTYSITGKWSKFEQLGYKKTNFVFWIRKANFCEYFNWTGMSTLKQIEEKKQHTNNDLTLKAYNLSWGMRNHLFSSTANQVTNIPHSEWTDLIRPEMKTKNTSN